MIDQMMPSCDSSMSRHPQCKVRRIAFGSDPSRGFGQHRSYRFWMARSEGPPRAAVVCLTDAVMAMAPPLGAGPTQGHLNIARRGWLAKIGISIERGALNTSWPLKPRPPSGRQHIALGAFARL
jgi:hypothetical protein